MQEWEGKKVQPKIPDMPMWDEISFSANWTNVTAKMGRKRMDWRCEKKKSASKARTKQITCLHHLLSGELRVRFACTFYSFVLQSPDSFCPHKNDSFNCKGKKNKETDTRHIMRALFKSEQRSRVLELFWNYAKQIAAIDQTTGRCEHRRVAK